VLWELIQQFARRMMNAEVEVRYNAGYGEVTAQRVNSRNGYRTQHLPPAVSGWPDLGVDRVDHQLEQFLLGGDVAVQARARFADGSVRGRLGGVSDNCDSNASVTRARRSLGTAHYYVILCSGIRYYVVLGRRKRTRDGRPDGDAEGHA
jgi:hypothetical protein